jgi:exosortase D (VPLPA-CTERM-specific)
VTTLLRLGRSGWAAMIIAAVLLLLVFREGLEQLVTTWGAKEEYSYGYVIPLIAAFLVWQRRDALRRMAFAGSWTGALIVVFGLALFIIGQLSTLYIVVQYAFLIALFGAVLAYTGWKPLTKMWAALALLVFMIPLPDFLYIQLSQQLQLLSSELGVAIVRLLGISVYLEGNVIDLGDFKLQVAEACSGLRYLFPLLTLSFITALFFHGRLWQRIVLFLAAIPITILMNSLRIAIIAVLVDRYGREQAQGFLHYFEGWVVFMVCFAELFGVIWLVTRLSGERRPFRELFAVQLPRPAGNAALALTPAPLAAWAVALLLVLGAVLAGALPGRAEAIPLRTDFSSFPMSLGPWTGHREQLEQVYIDGLKFTDYVLADYVRDGRPPLNLYISYYSSQRNGESAHSPRVCLPGGGWKIEEFGRHQLTGVAPGGATLSVNRAVIALGDRRELVYYWFQQRGRIITNEYLVKWYLFWDALTRNRSDGSMVRLLVPLTGDNSVAGDATLEGFTRVLAPQLGRFLPD